jgi:beta-lactamase regulating signal transducer with metallopeptidase domain
MLEVLAGAALRSLFLAAAVGTGLWLRRTYNPRVSLAAWTLVLAASLAMPVAIRLASDVVPYGIIAVGQLPLAPESLSEIDASFVTSRVEPDVPDAQPMVRLPWRELALFVYFAVFGALMLRLLAGLSLSWRITRAATPIRENWACGFDVRASRRIDGPATFGSVILLPGDHAAWTPARRLAVLAHEGAHVERRDFAIQLAACVNRTVFWFNPFSWWLQRHLSDLAEAASDDAAIAALNDRFGYAEILLAIAGRVSRVPSTVPMARHAAVASRIERILSETPPAAEMNWRGRAMLAGSIVPLAVFLSLLTILPAPPPPEPTLSAGAPALVEIAAGDAVAEGATQPDPSRLPADAAVAPRQPAATQTIAAPIVPPDPTPRTEVASLTPPAFTSAPPPRSAAAVREAPRAAPRPMPVSTLTGPPSRTMRQANRTANKQGAVDQSPRPVAIGAVAAPSSSTKGPEPAIGVTSADSQSPLFKSVVNETCMGTYSGVVEGMGTHSGVMEGAIPDHVRLYPILAHFYRGPGDAPWVSFHFAAQKAADLPVTIRGSEIKFTGAHGAIYTLLPSRNMLLPPRYHRLTGSTEHPPGGTIDFACREPNHPL